jgi:hypothetical protein
MVERRAGVTSKEPNRVAVPLTNTSTACVPDRGVRVECTSLHDGSTTVALISTGSVDAICGC